METADTQKAGIPVACLSESCINAWIFVSANIVYECICTCIRLSSHESIRSSSYLRRNGLFFFAAPRYLVRLGSAWLCLASQTKPTQTAPKLSCTRENNRARYLPRNLRAFHVHENCVKARLYNDHAYIHAGIHTHTAKVRRSKMHNKLP